MSPIRVVLADDHPIVRQGIKHVLEAASIDIVAEASTGRQALEMAGTWRPDVLVLDIMMPGMTGVEVLGALAQDDRTARIPVLVLSALNSESHVMAMLAAGAKGYVLKEEAPETIVQAVRVAARGQPWISPRIVAKVSSLVSRSQAYDLKLTRRERQILRLIAQGKSNQEIGNALTLAEQTVKNHVSNIFNKLGVNSRVSAALRALSLGLITWSEIEYQP